VEERRFSAASSAPKLSPHPPAKNAGSACPERSRRGGATPNWELHAKAWARPTSHVVESALIGFHLPALAAIAHLSCSIVATVFGGFFGALVRWADKTLSNADFNASMRTGSLDSSA